MLCLWHVWRNYCHGRAGSDEFQLMWLLWYVYFIFIYPLLKLNVMFHFMVFVMTFLGWTLRVGDRHFIGAGWHHRWALGDFGGVLRIYCEVWWHSLGMFHYLHSFPFVLLHSDKFHKLELLMGLTQLITPKVAFQEKFLAEHLSVIACWNQNKNIYRMG